MEKTAGNGDERVQAAARRVKRGDIQELKSLAAPPQGVKDILEAVQFLLGRPAHVATDYKKALCLLSGFGQNSLTQLIQTRAIHQVDTAVALRAKELLKSHTEDSIKSKSMASVSLFNWAIAMINAVEERGDSQTTSTEGK